MIILTAGHTGPNSGAQCAETHFDEGAENIWLRNRIAEILTNKYGLVVLVDEDSASLKLLVKALSEDLSLTENMSLTECTENTEDAVASPACHPDLKPHTENMSLTEFTELTELRSACHAELKSPTDDDFVIDIHFNAHVNPQARGAETIVADDATKLELRFASRLAHVTADALDIPLRSIKSESETPHRRLGMLHLTPQSVILEVCFCTSPEDVDAYRNNRKKLAGELAWAIAELILDRET